MASQKNVTLKDIAERARVSQSVVSTVLNDRQNGIFVSESTRQNVFLAAAALNYVAKHRALPPVRKPSQAVPGLAATSSHLVGLLLGRRFGGSLFTDIFYGVNETLSVAGYHPLVLDTYADSYQKAAEREAEGLRYALDNKFAGIVLWHEGGNANVPLIREIRETMPVIAIDRRVSGLDLDFVGTDNFKGGYDATKHLIDQGHTRIAHLTRLETTDSALGRLRGYQQALNDAGLEVNPRHILLALESGRRLDSDLIRQIFTGPNAPTAIFLLADFWAPPIYNELTRLGLRVPEDVALVGFDDVVQPGLDHLGLTSMAQDFERLGKTAGEMVLRRVADPHAEISTSVFPARLVVRQSSSPGELALEPLHSKPLLTPDAKPILA